MRTLTIGSTIGAVAVAGALLLGGTAASAAESSPAPGTTAGTHTCRGPAASLTADQCTAFRADMATVRAQRDAVLAKYGITAPAKGQRPDRAQVKALSEAQRTALKAELATVKTARDAVFTKYGLTPPAHAAKPHHKKKHPQAS